MIIYLLKNELDWESLGLHNTMSISVWLEPYSLGLGNSQYYPGWALNNRDLDNVTYWTVGFGGYHTSDQKGAFTVFNDNYQSNSILEFNQWYHLVAVLENASTVKIYINGSLENSYSITTPPQGTLAKLAIGKNGQINGGHNSYLWDGKIDDIRFYDYAISAAEILDLYHEGGWPGGNGLVAYYPFNGNANDESGNSHHGSIISNPFFIADRHGNQNSALSFVGIDDWIEVNSTSLFPSDAVTMCYWLNRNGNDITSLQNYISKDHSFQSYVVHLSPLKNRFSTGYWLGSPGVWQNYRTNYEVTDLNEWIFYAFSYDNNTQTAKSYVNGVIDSIVVETDPNYYLRPSN